MADTHFLQGIAVNKTYPGEKISGIRNTSFTIKQGGITAIIGESGSGKSTLLKLIYGLLSADSGDIFFKGQRILGPAEKLIPGHDAMKMVTQHTDDLNLFAKVWDNVASMLPHTDLKAKNEKTDKVLAQLKITAIAGKRVADLSGGEKQRTAIARALVAGAELLLLDEPFNQVDTSFREGLQYDIRQIVKETGLTVIIVSHDPAEVLSMADELLVLKDGEILETGSPKMLYQNPKHLYTARLLSNCNILNTEEARVLGIGTKLAYVLFYPEWGKAIRATEDNIWVVKQVLFKGCYEDLLLERHEITVRVLNDKFGKYKEGSKVGLKLKKWLEW